MTDTVKINFEQQNVQCRIPKECRITGDFHAECGVLVEGEISGGVVRVERGPLIVMPDAVVKGRIHVTGDLYVMGTVEGEHAAIDGVVYVTSTGRLKGSMHAQHYEVYAGSVMVGEFGKRLRVAA